MEGNSGQFRTNTWKYSLVKHNTAQSRILADNKELPIKFSPAKYADTLVSNTSKSLVRSKILSQSHDEIAIRDLKEATASKEKYRPKKSIIETPREMVDLPLNLKNVESQQSLNLKFDSPIKQGQGRKYSLNNQSLDFIKDIKIQYLKFKERVLNQLKKQQDSIKTAIHEIMLIISKNSSDPLSRSSIQMKTLSGIPPQMPYISTSVTQPISFSTKISIPAHMSVDTSKYRQSLINQQAQIESVIPKIRQKVNRMFDMMGQLRKEISQPSVMPLVFDKSEAEQ